jgi:hypothetical protein
MGVQSNPLYRPILQLSLLYKDNNDLVYFPTQVAFGNIKESFLHFDLNGFLMLEEAKGFTYDEDSLLSSREVKDVCESVLAVAPTEHQINACLIECVTETLDALQIVEKWTKND